MNPIKLRSLSRRSLQAVLEALPDAAMIIGRDRKILAVNRLYTESFAADAEDVQGRRCFEVSHRFENACDEMGEECPMQSCLETREPCQVVHVHHGPAGRERHIAIKTYPVTGDGGEVVAFLEVLQPFRAAAARPAKDRMVGRSPAFNRILELVRRVASRSTPVLLIGETGTGKELLARAVHELSDRAHKPFVPVDCSGISENLFESELFGHERGAFTGAASRRVGLVESVEGGTLFLDEVGDIPLSQQVKLLRLIENEVFRRVGSVRLLKAEFRLICATHRDLPQMVAEGGFRSDLYYRISAFPIAMPPLRERCGDLELLAESLLRQTACKSAKKLHPSTLQALARHDFPGNVRELRNVVERACMMADGDLILPDHLPAEFRRGETRRPPADDDEILPLEEVERQYLAWAVARFSGDNRELARRLGLSERTFYRKLSWLRSQEEDGGRHSSRG